MQGQEQQIEATILGIEPEGNGWVKINTDQGPFTTKFPEPIAEAQAYLNQRVLIAFQMGEASQGRNGQWYPAPRYFRRVAQPGYVQPQVSQPMAPQQYQAPPQQPQPTQPDQVEMRIMRQCAAKCAVWTMPLVPSDQRTFQNQLAVAEAWMRYFLGGVQGTGLGSLGAPAQGQAIGQEQAMAAMGGGMSADDIPF